MYVDEIYGYEYDRFGLDDMTMVELEKREGILHIEAASLMRSFLRFEKFCERVVFDALGENCIEDMHDNAAELDRRLYAVGQEHDAIICEIRCRCEAESAAGGGAGVVDSRGRFRNF